MSNRRPRRFDLTGQVFGALTVLSFAGISVRGIALWNCRCECGNIIVARSDHLRYEIRKTCAVGHRWNSVDEPVREHSLEYSSWRSAISRCHHPKNPSYRAYGARGIKVCLEWRQSFAQFLKDMGPRPDPSMTLDRIDNDRGYEPGNCRWATWNEQQGNKRKFKRVNYGGEDCLLYDVTQKLGLPYKTIAGRLRQGYGLGTALALPIRKRARKNLDTP